VDSLTSSLEKLVRTMLLSVNHHHFFHSADDMKAVLTAITKLEKQGERILDKLDQLASDVTLLKQQNAALIQRATDHQTADATALANVQQQLDAIKANGGGNDPRIDAIQADVTSMIAADDAFDPAAPAG
jgi:glutamyl/glutaminyl-tRNA synthetase